MSEPSTNRIHEVFIAALELDIEARARLLDHDCAGDGALRRAVEELLAIDAASINQCSVPGLGESGAEWLAADMATQEDLAGESAPARIGRFRIVREIGRGGMGIVYEAEQDEPARRVALKVIHPGMISRLVLRRFRHETRAMGQLMHPGIARIYEAGTGMDAAVGVGRPYFVMELVEGPTLVRYADDQNLGLSARLEMIARVCDALHHAHQKGVIHRDIKPDNILVQATHDAGSEDDPGAALRAVVQPKILDFGVARLVEEQQAMSLRTQSGQIVGTLPYMSPEQAEGESAVADIRSDVYSAGVMAFELLSGTLPFDTGNMPVHKAVKVVLECPAHRLGAVAPNLRGDIETIVHKAMDRSPDRRYQSAADLAADIRRYLAQQPIAAHPPSIMYQASKFVARHRALVGAAAVSILLLIAGVIVASLLAVAARQSERRAQWERYRSAVSAAAFAAVNNEAGIARRQLESTLPEFRGWEYRHLMGRIDQSTGVIEAPSIAMERPYVTAPAGSDDPHAVVLVGADMSRTLARLSLTDMTTEPIDPRLFIWYLAQASRSSWRHPAPGPALWTPDGSGGVKEHRLRGWPFSDETPFSRATLSGNGHILAFLGYADKRVALGVIDLRDDSCRRFDFDATFTPIRVALDHSGNRLALAGGAGEGASLSVRVLDTGTGSLISEATDIEHEVQQLLLSRDGSRITASLFRGGLGVWDVSEPIARRVRFLAEPHDSLQNLTYSPDETLLAGATTDGLLRLYDAKSLEAVTPPLIGHDGEVLGVAFLPGGDGIVTTGRDGSVRSWRAGENQSSAMILRGHQGTVMPLAVAETHRGSVLMTGGWDRTIKRWDLATGRLLGTTSIDREPIDLSVSPDQTLVVCMESNGMCRVIDVDTGDEVANKRIDSIGTRPIAFHADSRRVLVDWSPGKAATFWDVRTGELTSAPAEEMLSVSSPAISAPARVIAMTTFSADGQTTALYSIPSGERFDLKGMKRAAPEQIAFAPDGLRVAVAGPDNRIDTYDVRNRTLVSSYVGHTQEVLSIAFSPDGLRLFSSDYGGVICVWNAQTFEELIQLRGHAAHVRRIMVTSSGSSLISASGDSTVRVWTAPSRETIAGLRLTQSVLTTAHQFRGVGAAVPTGVLSELLTANR